MSIADKKIDCDLDLFSSEQVADPHPALDRLRELGPAVHMSAHDYWLLTRYADVKAATEEADLHLGARSGALRPAE